MKHFIFALLTLVFALSSGSAFAALTQTQISQLYVSIFGRASEGEGNSYWQTTGFDMAGTANIMLETDAAKDYFGSSLNSNQAFIEHIYLNTLNKTLSEDLDGIAYWVSLLNQGLTRGQVSALLVGVIKDYAPEGPYYDPADAATVTAYNQFINRVTISDYMADTVLKAPDDWATSTKFTAGGLNVTDDVATVSAAIGLINDMAGSVANFKPIASPISLNVDSSVPYFELQLIGSDPDGDTITYELISGASGVGYSLAYVNSATGMLYITNEPSGNDSFTLFFHVSDGKIFSDSAEITVRVTYLSEDEKNIGREEVDPEEYASFSLSTYSSDLLGGDSNPSLPISIDLSFNFPTPGDQGQQGSCVGWATAYALKSYQEKIEIGWSLNTSSHLFSPAFIYNQINGSNDQGAYIPDALNLAVQKGVSTLATMPYSDRDYLTQPSPGAFSEAASYRAVNWYRVNDTSQIKAALVNRKPVVCGISIYQSFYNLGGSNSVYNTADGNNIGGHAVTIVGYDDTKFGGAFKIINSWSASWGDDGYFWLPYSFAAQGIMTEAYVLEDAENGSTPGDEEPTEPEPDYNTLPNLTVSSWNASYDPRPRGTGTLTYEVINNGSGNAYLGADINLMLSRNNNITSSDTYVVYEEIPFDLLPGGSAYRDSTNALSFNFPDQIESGVYYMALWVDDMGEVEESNENDNISLGSSTITIENSMPDLSVNSWYADWDGYGNGTLTYEVENSGVSAINSTNWYINLVLDVDQTIGNGNEIFLFYEQAAFYLNPGATIYRNNSNSAYFNLYVDHDGYSVPSGVYYMALWVDDLNSVDESNELNNGSYSWGVVNVSSYYGDALKSSAGDEQLLSGTEALGKAYNGKRLPPKDIVMKQVMITKKMSGEIKMQMLDEDPVKDMENSQGDFQTKQIASGTGLIFPSSERIPMPNGMPAHAK
jgi:C1A family cysteine protease